MKRDELFIGPLRYWLIWPVALAILFACGSYGLHVRHFVPFIFLLVAMVTVVVVWVVWSYHKGERVTREPIEQQDSSLEDMLDEA
jgi:O-antigen/teichoic acid export membrane protein